jgi:hypothetical protein
VANTSATGGFLIQTSSAVLEDDALLDFVQTWIVGILGGAILAQNVRPRWQPEPPNIPDDSVDWLAFGITRVETDVNAVELHYPAPGLGYDEIRRHEKIHFLCSFYGPHRSGNAKILRDGCQLAQNHEYLDIASWGFVESGDVVSAPEFVKGKWLYRVDLPLTLRRQVVRDYAVQNLASAYGVLNNEKYLTNITVQE